MLSISVGLTVTKEGATELQGAACMARRWYSPVGNLAICGWEIL